jgi:hypothetical protein
MIRRMVAWAFTFVTFMVTDDEVIRVLMIGSMGQEHYHSAFRPETAACSISTAQ